ITPELVDELRAAFVSIEAARAVIGVAHELMQRGHMHTNAVWEKILRPLGIGIADASGINFDTRTNSIFKALPPAEVQKITPEVAAAAALRARMARDAQGGGRSYPGDVGVAGGGLGDR